MSLVEPRARDVEKAEHTSKPKLEAGALEYRFEAPPERAAREAQNLDVMSALADADLPRLQAKFHSCGGFLTESQFVQSMVDHCPAMARIYHDAGCNPNPIRSVFYNIDADSDGKVLWDDLYSYAVDTARQRIRSRPADCIQAYGHTRSFGREDNVTKLRYLPQLDVLVVSSKHAPLQIAEPRTMQTLFEFSAMELGGHDVLPLVVENLPSVNGLVVFCSDMRLRCWMLTDKLPTYRPMRLDHAITQLRASNIMAPSVMLASDRQGQIRFMDYSRSMGEPSIVEVLKLHDPYMGGITDFCFCQGQEGKLVSAGYDGTLQLVDTTTKKSFTIGSNLTSTVTRVAYLDSHQAIICGSSDNVISSWATHTTQKPCTIFSDPSRPHLGHIVSVDTVANSPQVISCDSTGIMKIWDIRTFTCVQSLNNGQSASGESSGGDDASVYSHRNVSAAVYCGSTKEIVCADPASLTFHEYSHGTDPTLADQLSTIAVRHNPAVSSVVTMTASSLSLWSIEDGCIDTRLDTIKGKDLSCFCFDGKGRRVFIGTLDGYVFALAYHGGSILTEQRLHTSQVVAVEYSEEHRCLVTVGGDGCLSVFHNKDTPVSRMPIGDDITALAIQPQLGLIAVGTAEGVLVTVDMAHQRNFESEVRTKGGSIRCLCFLGNFPLLAVGHAKGEISIFTCRPVLESLCILQCHVSKMNTDIQAMQRTDSIAGAMGFHRRRSINPVAASMGITDTSFSVDITQLRFHPERHELIIGDSSGRITVVSLCELLQHHQLPQCTYPHTPPFSLFQAAFAFKRGGGAPPPPAPSPARCASTTATAAEEELPHIIPRFVAGVRAHLEEILDMEVIPHLDVIITASEDKHVFLWNMSCEAISELASGRLPDGDSTMVEGTSAAAEGPTATGGTTAAPKRRGLAHHYKIAAMAAAKPPPKMLPYVLPDGIAYRLSECLAATPSRGMSASTSSTLRCEHDGHARYALPEPPAPTVTHHHGESKAKQPAGPFADHGWQALTHRRSSVVRMKGAAGVGEGEVGLPFSSNLPPPSPRGGGGVDSTTGSSSSLLGAAETLTTLMSCRLGGEAGPQAGGNPPPHGPGTFRAFLKPDRHSATRSGSSRYLQPLLAQVEERHAAGSDGSDAYTGPVVVVHDPATAQRHTNTHDDAHGASHHAADRQPLTHAAVATAPEAHHSPPGEAEGVDWAQQTAAELGLPPPSAPEQQQQPLALPTADHAPRLQRPPTAPVAPPAAAALASPLPSSAEKQQRHATPSERQPSCIHDDTAVVPPYPDFIKSIGSSIRRVKDLQEAHQHWDRLSSVRSSRPVTARVGVAIADCSPIAAATAALRRPATGDSSKSSTAVELAKLRLGSAATTAGGRGGAGPLSPRSLTSRPSTALVHVPQPQKPQPATAVVPATAGTPPKHQHQQQQQQQQPMAQSVPGCSRVGIHMTVTPRVASGNMYVSRVRHDAPGLGRTTAPVRPAMRPDNRLVRINMFEDELRRCLIRPKPPEDSELDVCQWKGAKSVVLNPK